MSIFYLCSKKCALNWEEWWSLSGQRGDVGVSRIFREQKLALLPEQTLKLLTNANYAIKKLREANMEINPSAQAFYTWKRLLLLISGHLWAWGQQRALFPPGSLGDWIQGWEPSRWDCTERRAQRWCCQPCSEVISGSSERMAPEQSTILQLVFAAHFRAGITVTLSWLLQCKRKYFLSLWFQSFFPLFLWSVASHPSVGGLCRAHPLSWRMGLALGWTLALNSWNSNTQQEPGMGACTSWKNPISHWLPLKWKSRSSFKWKRNSYRSNIQNVLSLQE